MRRAGWIAIALVLLLAAGLLQASNMGFKLNRTLLGPKAPGGTGTGNTGQNVLGLPYYQQTNLLTAANLATDIAAPSAAATVIANISRLLTASDTFQNCVPSLPATCTWSLTAGEAYVVKIRSGTGQADRSYIAVGSHNPGLPITLRGVGDSSKSGNNYFAPPYHTTNANLLALANELGGSAKVSSISRFNPTSDTFTNCLPTVPATCTPVGILPGQGYVVKMKSTVVFTPSHY